MVSWLANLDKAAMHLGFGSNRPPPRHMRWQAVTALGLLIVGWVGRLGMPESIAATLVFTTLPMIAVMLSCWIQVRGPISFKEPSSDAPRVAWWRALAQTNAAIVFLLMLFLFAMVLGSTANALLIDDWPEGQLPFVGWAIASVLIMQGALPALLLDRDVDPAE